MTGTDLIRPLSSVAWELRAAWATGRRVAATVDGGDRLEGHVQRVAATGAFCVISGRHAPLDRVLAIHRPSRLGDSTVAEGERWRGQVPRRRPPAGQQQLEGAAA